MATDIENLYQALARFRSEVISSLTKLKVEIFALEYAVLNESGKPITIERLSQLSQAAQHDTSRFHEYFEKIITPFRQP